MINRLASTVTFLSDPFSELSLGLRLARWHTVPPPRRDNTPMTPTNTQLPPTNTLQFPRHQPQAPRGGGVGPACRAEGQGQRGSGQRPTARVAAINDQIGGVVEQMARAGGAVERLGWGCWAVMLGS